MTVSGDAVFTPDNDGVRITGANYATLRLEENDTTNLNTSLFSSGGDFVITTSSDNRSSTTDRFRLDHATGDIGFYNAAGSSQDFLWDASTGSLTLSGDLLTSSGIKVAGHPVVGYSSITGGYAANLGSTGSSTLNETHIYAGGNQRVIIDGSGNVGIGTDPSSELHVKGTNETQVWVDSAANTNPGIRFLENGTNKWTIANDASNDGFFFYDFAASAERMRIDSSGNVGIGTSNPRRQIHLHNSASATTKLMITNGATGESNDGQGFQLGIDSSGNAIVENRENTNLTFYTNNNPRITVLAGGNVGIGATPSTKLHLGGTAPGDSIIRQDSTASGTNWEIGERAAGKWQIFEDDTDSIVATFMSSGNVGIGTDSPSTVLDVNGLLGVGNARVHETRVNQTLALTAAAQRGGMSINSWYNSAAGPLLDFNVSRNNTAGSHTVIQDNDALGTPREEMTIR